MKGKIFVLALCFASLIALSSSADTRAITLDGRWVILKDDGTWVEEDEVSDVYKLPSPSMWYVSKSVDPLDDSTKINFQLTATKGENEYGNKPVLGIRWTKSGSELYINWMTYMGSDIYVEHRIGEGQPSRTKWGNSADNKASFYHGNVVEMIVSLMNADIYIAKATPYGDNPVTAVFDVRGLRDKAAEYSELQEWLMVTTDE